MSGKREIVFDTETTGFDAKGDDRITEIGCVEIIDFLPTGKQFHAYINPRRTVPEKVTEITGLTQEFLIENGVFFEDAAQGFLDFIGDSQLVAHNADFDRGFVNAELDRAGFTPILRNRFTDTLQIAREKFPGSPASLDALCKRFGVSLSSRNKHGAIIDSELLAEVYLQLNGGRARSLGLEVNSVSSSNIKALTQYKPRPTQLQSLLSEEELKSHQNFIASLGDDMIWNRYWRRASAHS